MKWCEKYEGEYLHFSMRGRLGHNYWDTLTLTTETLSHILMKHSYVAMLVCTTRALISSGHRRGRSSDWLYRFSCKEMDGPTVLVSLTAYCVTIPAHSLHQNCFFFISLHILIVVDFKVAKSRISFLLVLYSIFVNSLNYFLYIW